MNIVEQLLNDTQPNYVTEVRKSLRHLVDVLGTDPFVDADKDTFAARILDHLTPGPQCLDMLVIVSALNWWCGLPLSDATHARMGEVARASLAHILGMLEVAAVRADPAARRTHTVLAGMMLKPLHSPTRGAIAYARALAANPDVDVVEVLHAREMPPETRALADEVLGALAHKVRFEQAPENDQSAMVRLVSGPQRTYHFWCEHPFVMLPSFFALFGPTVSFTCADGAPVQYSDVYWYAHDAAEVARRWSARGAPAGFIANYRAVEAVPYTTVTPNRTRTRRELGFGEDEIVLAAVGNRLGVEMDQGYVDGMAGLVMQDPRLKWLFVGALQPYWIEVLGSVLGDQFQHIEYDDDLPSLLAHVDVFVNPFRVGGGNTAIMAAEAGCVVLTRGDLGDVPAFVPAAHHAADADDYFDRLYELIDDPVLRAAWRAEQGGLIGRRLDGRHFERELAELCRVAFDRFAARMPARLASILGKAA